MAQNAPPPDSLASPAPKAAAAARHPWHRWFARLWLDYAFAGLMLGILLAFVAPTNTLASNDYALMWVAALLWIPAEAVFIASIGTTPGKYLVGIRVEKRDGRQLSLSEALTRSASAWAIGCALMLPLVPLITLNTRYNRLKNGKKGLALPSSRDPPGRCQNLQSTANYRMICGHRCSRGTDTRPSIRSLARAILGVQLLLVRQVAIASASLIRSRASWH